MQNNNNLIDLSVTHAVSVGMIGRASGCGRSPHHALALSSNLPLHLLLVLLHRIFHTLVHHCHCQHAILRPKRTSLNK